MVIPTNLKQMERGSSYLLSSKIFLLEGSIITLLSEAIGKDVVSMAYLYIILGKVELRTY